jgi:hypothetical protein
METNWAICDRMTDGDSKVDRTLVSNHAGSRIGVLLAKQIPCQLPADVCGGIVADLQTFGPADLHTCRLAALVAAY